MTTPNRNVPLLPLSARPVFARKMLAVWRLHHLAKGDDLVILVWPGEWPEAASEEIKGVPVRESDKIGGEGTVLVLGRVGAAWRGAYNLAVDYFGENVSAEDLGICSFYMEVPDTDPHMRVWMHPSPETGEVPMWSVRRGR